MRHTSQIEGIKPTLKQVYDVTICGRIDDVEMMLKECSQGCQINDACVSLLRATVNVLSGDVPSAIAILKRANARSVAPESAYIADLLVPLLLTCTQFDEAEFVLNDLDDVVPDLVPALLALRAILCAKRGDYAASRRYAAEALTQADNNDEHLTRARVLQRCSTAGYYRQDLAEAEDQSSEAARLYELLGSFHHAAIAYSVPYAISHAASGSPARAKFYIDRLIVNSQRAGDLSWERYGLAASLEIAAEAGDEPEFQRAQARLFSTPLRQQYSERFSIALACALADGWAGRFESARSSLLALRDFNTTWVSQQILCDALLGLFASAAWDLENARRLARSVIGRSAYTAKTESMAERHHRDIARILAVATCFIIGDSVRGRRALSTAVDQDGKIIEAMTHEGMKEASVAEFHRGYARLINVVAKAAVLSRPACNLTKAELAVLRLLPGGVTLSTIASELGKSPETVRKQVRSVYSKLGAKNRIQAIWRAKDVGIL